MNVTRLMWTRLMCSRNRQEAETLQSKLAKAGIVSEIRYNPLEAKRGITRLEIVVDERDLFRASKVCQGLETEASADDAAGRPGGGRSINGFVKSEEAERVTEAEVLPSPSAESPREENPGRGPETGGAEPAGGFAQATALLEKQVEELLVAESKLTDRGASLEEKVKTLEESLAQASADLAGEASNRASAEKKLTEVCEARALLEKETQALKVRFKACDELLVQARAELAGEVSNRARVEQKLTEVGEARALLEREMQALEVRSKAAERTLVAFQARLESQTRELSDHQARTANLEQDLSSRAAQLESIGESLTKARAGMEQEKDLRLAAEQKSGDLAAALKSLECQLAQQARQREQLLNERRDEQEQMRVCVAKVNALCSRVSAVRAARERQ